MAEVEVPVSFDTEVDVLFGQYVGAGQSPGLVYGLTTEEGLAHTACFGAADVNGTKLDIDTIFPIASMSKSFVAAAALVARERGLLSLTDPITKYVPEFVVANENVRIERVPTLEMLLSMCGGLTEDNSWVDPFLDLPTEQMLAQVAKGVRLSRYPGAAYEYSNLGFSLAGLALSRAVGSPLEDFVSDAVFSPLGLSSTHFDSALPDGADRAVGYAHNDGKWVPFAAQESDAFAAAGGIVSSVRDLARWITWLGSAFRPPRDDDVDVLSRAGRRELQRVHILMPPSLALNASGAIQAVATGYGLGLVVATDLRHGAIICHGGGLPGFRLFMTWHPVSGNGAVVLTNSQRGDPFTPCSEALSRMLRRRNAPATAVELWPETIRLRDKADRLIRNWDDALATEILADNLAFERPLAERRAEIERLVAEVGPLSDPGRRPEIVSALTPADVTWSIPGENGELLCMIHLTPVEPVQVQEFVVRAASGPRVSRPTAVSPQHAAWFEATTITPISNVRVEEPEPDDK